MQDGERRGTGAVMVDEDGFYHFQCIESAMITLFFLILSVGGTSREDLAQGRSSDVCIVQSLFTETDDGWSIEGRSADSTQSLQSVSMRRAVSLILAHHGSHPMLTWLDRHHSSGDLVHIVRGKMLLLPASSPKHA